MNAGQNLTQGFLQGFSLTESILDGVEERKHRGVLRQREEEQYQYQKKRQGVLDERQDTQYQQQQDELAYQKERRPMLEEREQQLHDIRINSAEDASKLSAMRRKQLQTQMEQQAKLGPMQEEQAQLELEAAKYGLDSTIYKAERQKIQDRQLDSATAFMTAQELTAQAQEALQSGDTDRASVLSYEIDRTTKDIGRINGWSDSEMEIFKSQGGTEIRSLVEQGLQSMQSGQPMPKEANKRFAEIAFAPVMAQTGRTEKGLTVVGMERDGDKFYPILKNKKGEIVPPTKFKTEHPDDPIVSLSMQDVMGASQQVIQQADLVQQMNTARAAGAKAGVQVRGTAKKNDQQTLEEMRHKNRLLEDDRETANNIKEYDHKQGSDGGGSDSIDDDLDGIGPKDSDERAEAKLLAKKLGLKSGELGAEHREFVKWARDNEDEYTTILDKVEGYAAQKQSTETQSVAAKQSTEVTQEAVTQLKKHDAIKSAGLSDNEIEELHNEALQADDYNAHIENYLARKEQKKSLKEKADARREKRKAEREAAKAAGTYNRITGQTQ